MNEIIDPKDADKGFRSPEVMEISPEIHRPPDAVDAIARADAAAACARKTAPRLYDAGLPPCVRPPLKFDYDSGRPRMSEWGQVNAARPMSADAEEVSVLPKLIGFKEISGIVG